MDSLPMFITLIQEMEMMPVLRYLKRYLVHSLRISMGRVGSLIHSKVDQEEDKEDNHKMVMIF